MAGPSRRRPWLVALGALTVVGVAALAITTRRADDTVNSDAPGTGADVTPGADAETEPVASPDDAVAAAVRYVASTGELFAHSPVGRLEILRKLVTPEALPQQAAALDETAHAMSEKFAHPIEEYVWVEAPLTAGIEDHRNASGEVTVAVWTVAVLAHPSGGLVEQVWRTVHVTLEPADGRWLVAEAWTDSGPTPTANELALPSSVDDYLTVAHLAPVIAHEGL